VTDSQWSDGEKRLAVFRSAGGRSWPILLKKPVLAKNATSCRSCQPDASHQRKHDFGYGDKADGECDNGDGELVTDHSVGLGITGRLNDTASESLS
jgi:hypothetical protein